MQTKYSKTKWPLLALALALCSAAFAAESERVISCDNLAPINKLLAEGWSVKHQAVSVAQSGESYNHKKSTIYLFTLTAPTLNVIPVEKEVRDKPRRSKKK